MQAVSKKAVTVVLAAVVVFMMAFPVPIKGLLIEKARYEQAKANPVIAVPVILGTALAAAGVYVTGTTASQYNGNLESVYQGISNGTQWYSEAWASYVQEKGSFDAAMQSAITVDGESINLQVLADEGFYDTVNQYTAYVIANNEAMTGASSIAANESCLCIGNAKYLFYSDVPSVFNDARMNDEKQAMAQEGRVLVAWVDAHSSRWPVRYHFYYATSANPAFTQQSITSANQLYMTNLKVVVFAGDNINSSRAWEEGSSLLLNPNSGYLNPGVTWESQSLDVRTEESTKDGIVAVVADAIAQGIAEAPTSTVEPFTPTAEQLAEGYTSADVVEAINSGNETTSGIAEDVAALLPAVQGLAGLLSPLAGIAANVAGIDTNVTSILSNVAGLASAPFTWLAEWWATLTGWWNELLTWLGDTPFGNVMGTVISGVQALPGAIGGAATDVLGGIAAIPGALQGWLEGILDGVLSIPGSIAGVIEGIQQAVSDMAGAIEGIFEPFIRPTMPVDTGGTVGIALPPGLFEAEKFDLSEKVPFCYLIRSQSALTTMFSNFATYRSFYFDLDVPFAGNIRFDGEPVLSQSFGAFDIADTIKGLATGLLCLGLLYRAYRVFERQMGGA